MDAQTTWRVQLHRSTVATTFTLLTTTTGPDHQRFFARGSNRNGPTSVTIQLPTGLHAYQGDMLDQIIRATSLAHPRSHTALSVLPSSVSESSSRMQGRLFVLDGACAKTAPKSLFQSVRSPIRQRRECLCWCRLGQRATSAARSNELKYRKTTIALFN